MALRRARSIDRLFDLVDDHDRVLTADAPLALALNRRTEGAHLGDFATTPRNFAKQGLEVADRRDLFHEVVRSTELSFKQAATNLDVALRCWEDTGRLRAVLEHTRHDPASMRSVVDVLETVESAYSLREDVTVPGGLDVAVVDPGAFSALDRRVLPEDGSFEAIDPFEPRGRFEPDGIDLMPSTMAIAETIEAHVTPANAGDVGIVLDPSGPLRPLIEATLEARSIPYHAEEPLAEHPGLRSFLRVLRTGLSRTRLRGRDVRGLLVEIGLPAPRLDDDKRIEQLSGAGAAELQRLWDGLSQARLSEVLDAFTDLAPQTPRELAELVRDLGIEDAPVTRKLVNALEFYLDTFRVERDYSREGVLLASGRDNAYVDRPLVFHLGLGTDWAQSVRSDPWIDADERKRRERQDLARFERLLQSGRRRVYIAQDTRRGQPVTPCFHLHELVDAEFERFAELESTPRSPPGRTEPAEVGFVPEEGLVDPDRSPATTLSSSDLDRLSYCPRDWFMDQLVPEPDRLWFRRGQLFHAFAELAVVRPDLVGPGDDELLGELVQVGLDALEDLLDPDERPSQATELRIGFTTIVRWLAENPPEDEPPEAYTAPPPDRRGSGNPFAEHLGVEIEATRTERWFQDEALGVHGKVDLVHAVERLVDWKSTRRPDSLPRTVRRTRVGEGDAPPRFQPAVYLLHHRAQAPGRPLEFALVDVLDRRTEAIRGDLDVEAVTRRLAYRPCSFEEFVATREAYERIVESSQKRKDVFEAVGYPAYRSYVTNADMPEGEDRTAAKTGEFADGLVDLAQRKRGAPAKSEQAARSAVGKLVRLKDRTLFGPDLDRTAEHVDRVRDRLTEWRASRFPVPDDVDMDEVHHRDLILRDLSTHRATTWIQEGRRG